MTAPAAMPWKERPGDAGWKSPDVTARILGDDPAGAPPIPLELTQRSLARVQEVEARLSRYFVGLHDGPRGSLTEWALACLIARENLLLLGPPGVAKTEIAERIFQLQGLQSGKNYKVPKIDYDSSDLAEAWRKREAEERRTQKYFRYLLSRFTQPEELFGPIEIQMLRRGMLVHVNFGLLTSPGVRAAFLDEIFKASSSILNALLTLVLEREYFNWGGMCRSDLVMFIGASNELPGGLATGHLGVGAGAEDFNLLYAFLDRFPLRLEIPNASGTSSTAPPHESNLARATETALHREMIRFTKGDPFANEDAPCSINDALLVGRALMESAFGSPPGLPMFDSKRLAKFTIEFFKIGAFLQANGTGMREGTISWTISPRKLKALYKIALAHAVVRDRGFAKGGVVAGPDQHDLHVFDFIWDTPVARDNLRGEVEAMTARYA